MLIGIIIGVILGFFFKPQIENGMNKVSKYIKDRNNRSDDY